MPLILQTDCRNRKTGTRGARHGPCCAEDLAADGRKPIAPADGVSRACWQTPEAVSPKRASKARRVRAAGKRRSRCCRRHLRFGIRHKGLVCPGMGARSRWTASTTALDVGTSGAGRRLHFCKTLGDEHGHRTAGCASANWRLADQE